MSHTPMPARTRDPFEQQGDRIPAARRIVLSGESLQDHPGKGCRNATRWTGSSCQVRLSYERPTFAKWINSRSSLSSLSALQHGVRSSRSFALSCGTWQWHLDILQVKLADRHVREQAVQRIVHRATRTLQAGLNGSSLRSRISRASLPRRRPDQFRPLFASDGCTCRNSCVGRGWRTPRSM